MKAIRVHKTGDPSVLAVEELSTPRPGNGEALVQIKASGVNFVDIYQRSGQYPVSLPFTPGFEGSGIVEAVGQGVTDLNPGDRVAYTGNLGSYAEFNVVHAKDLIPLAPGLTFEQGAAFPLQGMTAQYLLHEFYPIKRGDTLLIHAAAGGVGGLLVQWAKHMGARVLGTVSTEEKAKIALEEGADHVILYSKQDFAAEVKNLTAGRGADYIIDGVGRSTFPKDLEAVRERGHICVFGSSSGAAEPIAPRVLQARSLTLHGGSLFNFLDSRVELLMRAGEVLNGISEGWLKLRISNILPLQRAAEAHRLLETRKTIGKVILKAGD